MQSRHFIVTVFFLLGLAGGASAQNICYSPILGGATDTSVRILFFTRQTAPYQLQVSDDQLYDKPIIINGVSDSTLHNRTMVNVSGLRPATTYFYRILFGGEPDKYQGHFRTFPAPGTRQHYVVTTGSCQETANMKVFEVMAKHHPDIFIHTGDWTYPDYMIPGYPHSDESVFKGYERRYTEKVMKDMLPFTLTDYITDNHDGIGGGAAHNHLIKATYKTDPVKGIVNYFITDTILPAVRSRVNHGYVAYYPGYPMQDTTIGVYHSFKMGNSEFFVLDIREDASYQVNAFKYDSTTNHWTYDPPKGHKIIGDKQMKWLKDGLKNSTADWKFLVMGIPFNKNVRHLIDLGIHYQDMEISAGGETGTGLRLAASWSFYWGGYPESQKDLLDFIHDNNIKDVLVISGDTHHNVMDDGRNAGLPEINASGLSVTGTTLAHYMNLIGIISGYPNIKKYLWNGGGNGIHNKNYKNAFGKIDIYGRESVRMSFVDEDDHEICAVNIPHSSRAVAERKYHKPLYMKRVERISYASKPTAGIRFIKTLAKAFLHKKTVKTKGDLT